MAGRTVLDEPVAPRPFMQRGGWALPAEPPESWVGAVLSTLFLAALALAAALPVILRDDTTAGLLLAVVHSVAGAAALLTGYLLLVQATVTGDPQLRWLAAGYAVLTVVVVVRSGLVQGTEDALTAADLDRGAGMGLLWQLTLPVVVLCLGLVCRSHRLLVLPALVIGALAALVLLQPAALPALVERSGDDQSLTSTLRLAHAAVAVLAAGAAALWWRRSPLGLLGPWGIALLGLLIAPAVGAVRSAASERYDELWWTSVLVEDAALVVPALGLTVLCGRGYFRQARRWHQLEDEVRRLRTATALLPGRSITPEDEAGLPEQREVRELVDQRRLKIALQPVVELDGGAVVGHEALSRFGGRTPTDRWFRAASRYGLGGELEQVTLEAALALLPTLPGSGFLAVNVSPAALTDPIVLRLLHGSDLERIVVEITEHEAVADYPSARAALDRLRAEGARIAVDDTGAGFASLRHVLLLQPDIIKLDTSITRDVETDARQRALVLALMSFADEVGSEVLAEGVETEEQRLALMEIGVPIGQGWHLGLPAIPDEGSSPLS